MYYVAHPSSEDGIQWFEFTKMVPQYIFQMFLMKGNDFCFLAGCGSKSIPQPKLF